MNERHQYVYEMLSTQLVNIYACYRIKQEVLQMQRDRATRHKYEKSLISVNLNRSRDRDHAHSAYLYDFQIKFDFNRK